MARTDIRAVDGLDAAIDRAKALVDAGADAIFPEAMRDLGEFEAVRAADRRADPGQHDRVRQERPVHTRPAARGRREYRDLAGLVAAHGDGRRRTRPRRRSRPTGRSPPSWTRCSIARDLYDLLDYEGYNKFDASVFNFRVAD